MVWASGRDGGSLYGPVPGGPSSPALLRWVGDGLTGDVGIELMSKWAGPQQSVSSLPSRIQ